MTQKIIAVIEADEKNSSRQLKLDSSVFLTDVHHFKSFYVRVLF